MHHLQRALDGALLALRCAGERPFGFLERGSGRRRCRPGLLGNAGQSNYGTAKAAVASMAIIMDREMSRYGVCINAIAPVARTRLTIDATPQTAATMPQHGLPPSTETFFVAKFA